MIEVGFVDLFIIVVINNNQHYICVEIWRHWWIQQLQKRGRECIICLMDQYTLLMVQFHKAIGTTSRALVQPRGCDMAQWELDQSLWDCTKGMSQ